MIVRVELGRLDYPLIGEFKFFKRGARPSLVVRLTDDTGLHGWGQAVPVESWTYETVESVASTLEHYLAPAVLGADPCDLEDIHARMERAIRPSFSVGQPLAKCAIDLACYDLWGRRSRKSVAELLGGARRDEIKLSWTIQAPTLAVAERLLEQGRAAGYDSFNVKLGPPQTPQYDLELVRKVISFSPGGFHWADANTSYDLATALAIAPRLGEAGLRALESPMPPNRIRDYQALARQGALPILMDEGVVSPVEAAEFIALGMMNGIAMKVARCGGLWHAKKIVEELENHQMHVFGSGLTDPDLSLAASLHLFAWAGFERPAALNGPQYLGNLRLHPTGDMMRVPSAPGLGIELEANALKTVAWQKSASAQL